METPIPYIDTNVEHVGVSRLRRLNSDELRHITKTMVFQDNDEPLAVLLRYEQYLIMQNKLNSLMETIELLTDQNETKGLVDGLGDLKANRTKSISKIKSSLKRKVNA